MLLHAQVLVVFTGRVCHISLLNLKVNFSLSLFCLCCSTAEPIGCPQKPLELPTLPFRSKITDFVYLL